MTKIERCLWIVEAFLNRGPLSLEELNMVWKKSVLYDNREILPRTFIRYREYIAEVMDIEIDYFPQLRKYDIVVLEGFYKKEGWQYLLRKISLLEFYYKTLLE